MGGSSPPSPDRDNDNNRMGSYSFQHEMDMNTYSHYYYATYYPEYYAQLKASSIPAATHSNKIESISTPIVAPALGSKVAGQKAFRQMSHFFDYESYNDAINQELKDGKRMPVKFSKKEIKILKHRKIERKKKRMLDWLHND